MTSLLPKSKLSRSLFVAALCAPFVLATAADAAKRKRRPATITRPKYDKTAEKVDLFDGIKKKQLNVYAKPKDSTGGRVFFENKTDKPLTVKVPRAFVGVQKQVGAGGPPGGPGGGLGLGGPGQGQGQGQGGQQPVGGGFGGGGLGGGGLGGGYGGGAQGGGGFFSIPPKRVVAIKYNSVCLAHGKPDPHPRATYRIMPMEEYTKDETLQEMITLVATGKLNQMAAQAATWHITDKMSWRELALKKKKSLGGLSPRPYFHPLQLRGAYRIHALAQARARERAKSKKNKTEPRTPRTRLD